MRITGDEARQIALLVLEQHGIEIRDKNDVDLIADGLGIASDDEFFLTAAARDSLERHKHRSAKIRLLEKLLAAYQSEMDDEQRIRSKEGTFKSMAHYWMQVGWNRDLEDILASLESLLEVEHFISERYPPETLPNSRPPTAKNAGAECVFRILAEHSVSTWKACAVIADMLIAAGIEKNTPNKVQRALYDKLKRVEVR